VSDVSAPEPSRVREPSRARRQRRGEARGFEDGFYEAALGVGRDRDSQGGAGGGEGVLGPDGQADVPGEVLVPADAGAAGDPGDDAASGVVAPVGESGPAVVGGGDHERRRLEAAVTDGGQHGAGGGVGAGDGGQLLRRAPPFFVAPRVHVRQVDEQDARLVLAKDPGRLLATCASSTGSCGGK
jgi:hypothetical protein